jgi:phosphoglycerate dehydrogenase-like enzyme
MNRVLVGIATPLDPDLVAEIVAVDERVEVVDAPAALSQAEVLLLGAPRDGPALQEAVRGNDRLRWVHSIWAGAGEQLAAAKLTTAELERVTVTTSAGVHATPLGEFVLFGLLAFAKGLPRLLRDKENRQWDHYAMDELRDRTVLVLGLGGIGREVVRLASGFGMRTIGIKRTPGDVPRLDELHPPERLRELLPRADAVVVTLPRTEATRGLLDREALALLRPHAVFVNVGRGAVVDQDALVEALVEGRLRGAVLDVFAQEPLPAESPLWELPNVLLAPHTAALSVHENERIVELFCENLQRYLRGEELRNRVDPEHYY